jgi:hypothetical protein
MQQGAGKAKAGTLLAQASGRLAARDAVGAEALCQRQVIAVPHDADAWALLARARQQRGDFPGMADAANAAHRARSGEWALAALLAEAELLTGATAAARARLAAIEIGLGPVPAAWERLTALHTQMFSHGDAARCAARFAAIDPARGALLLANSDVALGRLAEAESRLDAVIAADPRQADAWYNRAVLRRQTPAANHVDALRSAIARIAPDDPAAVPLGYALAKELEDLSEYAGSFAALSRAAMARRRRLSYDVAADIAMIDTIIDRFDNDWLRQQEGYETAGPLFVIGLPRTGTTLVDRILSAHPQVASRDEANDFTYALLCEATGPGALADRARSADMAKLGARYWRAMQGYGEDAPRLLNKTPANYLYAGLIAAALPGARIINVRRQPMDAGYAIYKTLFRTAYPFSYDLDELGRYMAAHSRLMAHWRQVLPPGRMLDIDYEALVADQEGATRQLLDFAGLEWDPACLDFHANPAATATASAAQVREPIHSRSVGLWRVHEQQLAPLARALGAALETAA